MADMFDKILVANRGEIACRVMRTARRLGVRTVAVYSDADAGAKHVAMADEAYRIGPAPARESYLQVGAILEAARRSGARAVHPGYGFLSENAEFAEACAAAGVVFIGPPAAAIRAMGSKSAAKRLMEGAGVPLVPGYHGEDQAPARLAAEAARIGWPVLVKASAGGGGKGMRAVSDAASFQDALAGAKREALASFGDDRVLLERYLAAPRHVEIQVFADGQGHAVHVFERDCSIQRRHQKVLEEAPAPGVSAALREEMGRAAVAAARAIGYVGAGTVEFLLDEGRFYFMEMNTRLQVEHPVTELITGHDLVEWQLRVAAGEPLPVRQEDLAITGHAIEARVYAEDPSRDFLPSTGILAHLRPPAETAHVRIDTGVREGDAVTVHYDPLIAKLVVWDTDRAGAVRRLRAALAEYQVVGVTTNLAFLGAVAAHPAYLAAELDTRFIERHRAGLVGDAAPATDAVLAIACLDVLLRRAADVAEAARASLDPHSPWHGTDGWRLNADYHHAVTFVDGGKLVRVVAHYRPGGLLLLELPGGPAEVRGERSGADDLVADIGGARVRATVVRSGDDLVVMSQGRGHRLTLHDPDAAAERDVGVGSLVAPMPGKVIAVMVEPGALVKKGAPLLILEAMKMEHTVTAPRDGRVAEVHFEAGAVVSEGAQLLALEPEDEAA